MRHVPAAVAVSAILLMNAAAAAAPEGLAIATSDSGAQYLTYKGEPLFAFGPGDEVRLVSGMADTGRWATWQRENGMNLVRAYPMSMPGAAWNSAGKAGHPFVERDGKWDVDTFNDAYFEHLGAVARELEEADIILHLQLWQIVIFKGGSNRWDASYLNPANNVNEWTSEFDRGARYIDAPEGSRAREHQKEWVLRVLDAVKGRGNVLIDVINELGNEMGTIEWAAEVASWIRDWERENDWDFLVGVDSEHHYTPGRFEPFADVFDVIILNELVSREHAMSAIARLNKPAVTVRSSDDRNQRDHYMFVDANGTGPEHQTRYRTLCYRAMFAGVQSVGAYWKMPVEDADYREMEHWPVYARAIRAFWNRIRDHRPDMVINDALVVSAVTPHAYALRAVGLVAVYLECGHKTWNNAYPESVLELSAPLDPARVELFDTKTGEVSEVQPDTSGGTLRIPLPAFTDDIAVLVHGG
jgi:hypothetical protein